MIKAGQQSTEVSPDDWATITQFLEKMLVVNRSINLTAVRDYDSGVVLHIEDSLAGFSLVQRLLKGRLADIGSGSGFPGVALAIALHEKCDLVDSSSKKMKAVAGILRDMQLDSQIITHAERIEDHARANPNGYNMVTARALASIRVSLELAAPLLETGGHLLLYKSSKVDEELEEASPMADKVGMMLAFREDTCLSNGDPRTLVVFEKTHEPLITLPRRVGKAQKSPLS